MIKVIKILTISSLALFLGAANAQETKNDNENSESIKQSKTTDAQKNFSVWLSTEVGAAWQIMNDVQIPVKTGTRFSLLDFGTGPFLAGRIYLGTTIFKNHDIRILYAPLTIKATGKLKQNTTYMGEDFSASEDTKATYTFNSYRLTYRYALLNTDKYNLKIGLTAKIRDAEIKLEQNDKTGSRDNLGVVPLLHLATDYNFTNNIRVMLDIDALAAPQGRAEDVSLQLAYNISKNIQVHGGFRTVEGGAASGADDKKEGVYNFTWLAYAITGMTIRY